MIDVDLRYRLPCGLPPRWLMLLLELKAPFLGAAVIPVLLGASLAFHHTGTWNWPLFAWTLAGMMLIHIGVNTVRECLRHLNADDMQFGLPQPRQILCMGLACLAAGCAVGIYLCFRVGSFILFLGAVGLLGAFCYAAPRLNLIARTIGGPGIALVYGILPALGAYYAQTGNLSPAVVLVSLPAALLVAAVLFVSQLPDHDGPRETAGGTRTASFAGSRAARTYSLLMSLWMIPVFAAVAFGICPVWCLAALIPSISAFQAVSVVRRYSNCSRELFRAVALSAASHLAVGALLSASLVMSRLV